MVGGIPTVGVVRTLTSGRINRSRPVGEFPERLAVVEEIDPRLEATPLPMSAARLRGVAWRRPGARGSHAETARPVRSASPMGQGKRLNSAEKVVVKANVWSSSKVNLPSDHQYVQLHRSICPSTGKGAGLLGKVSGMSAVQDCVGFAERLRQANASLVRYDELAAIMRAWLTHRGATPAAPGRRAARLKVGQSVCARASGNPRKEAAANVVRWMLLAAALLCGLPQLSAEAAILIEAQKYGEPFRMVIDDQQQRALISTARGESLVDLQQGQIYVRGPGGVARRAVDRTAALAGKPPSIGSSPGGRARWSPASRPSTR